ncbi:MAG: sensor histidine kinase [Actinomycetes bacterium]
MRRSAIGLRTTIMLSFAVGAMALSATMAVGTYLVARNYLVEQRERAALRQAFADASYVRDGLLTSGAEVSDVLGAVSPPADATVVVRRADRWFSSSLQVGEDDVPSGLRGAVTEGSVALVWEPSQDAPAVMVGVPLPAVDAQFFEIAGTPELDRTLNALRVVLTVFAVITAGAGAVLGRWAARRVVAPLDSVAGAAARIAGGALDTRLPTTEDPDLATIVGSFNSMIDAVNERIERDARFAADVSHELRSPLTALVTSVEVIDGRRGELSERSQRALDLVRSDLQRFQRALQDLLELGRLEAGAAAQVRATVGARDLVRHALEAAGRPADVLRADERGAHPVVAVDKAQLQRALVNLFENADRHGGGLTCVSVSQADDAVLIQVEDEGPGVPAADRERIFERFVRGGSRGSLPGAGLGLSLVYETVRAHGGAVWCTPGEGGVGSRFTLRLPSPEVGAP